MSRYLWRVVAVVAALGVGFAAPSVVTGSGRDTQKTPIQIPGSPTQKAINLHTGIISVTVVNEGAPDVKHRYLTKKFDSPQKSVSWQLSYYDLIGGQYKLRVTVKNAGNVKNGLTSVGGVFAGTPTFAGLKDQPVPILGPGKTLELHWDDVGTFLQGAALLTLSLTEK